MGVYEEEEFLRQSLQSISNQTFEEFELVIVEDPSDDETGAILDEFERRESRLVRIQNDQRLGFVRSLNRGLERCQGEFVARMDGDDVAHPDRLARQVQFLDANPDVGIVGSYYRLLDENGEIKLDHNGQTGEMVSMPESDLAIRWRSFFGCPFGHPTVTVRRRVVTDNDLRYSEHYPVTEDYDLWTRLLRHTQGRNLATPLLFHRRDPQSNRSTQYAEEQLRDHDKIAYRTIREEFPEFDVTLAEVSQLRVLLRGGDAFVPHDPREQPDDLLETYLGLLDAFTNRYSDSPEVDAVRRTAEAQTLAFVQSPPTASDAVRLGRLLASYPHLSLELLKKLPRVVRQPPSG